jgi:hypothetical protein
MRWTPHLTCIFFYSVHENVTVKVMFICTTSRTASYQGSRVAQRSKTLHLSARRATVVPGLNPGCITSGCARESHVAAHNWPSVVRCKQEYVLLTDLPS